MIAVARALCVPPDCYRRRSMTSKTMTRNQFLRGTAGLVGATTILGTLGCGDDDGNGESGADSGTGNPPTTDTDEPATDTGDPPGTETGDPPGTETGDPPGTDTGDPPATGSEDSTGPGAGCEADPGVTIGTNHGHEMVVPLADVEAGVEVVSDIQGGSPHPHSVTVTADDFAALAAGMTVMVTSSMDSGHTHEVSLVCGG